MTKRVSTRTLGETGLEPTRLALGLAALGRPAYINRGRELDLGGERSRDAMRARTHAMLDAAVELGIRAFDAATSALAGAWPHSARPSSAIMPDEGSLTGPLEVLLDEGAELIVVGGLACVIQGAPFVTQDVDVVHRRTDENVDRILRGLRRLDARVRGRPGPPILPTREAFLGTGHQLLMTTAGPIDLLGAIEAGADFDALLDDTMELELSPGRSVPVLRIERILALKASSPHAKDQRTVSALRALLTARREGDG